MKNLLCSTLLVLGSAFLLSGCGGGGGGGGGGFAPPTIPTTPEAPDPTPPTPDPPTQPTNPAPSVSLPVITGTVEDGPIENARVFVDLNGNGAYDEGEPDDLTDSDGVYEISRDLFSSGRSYVLVAEGSSALGTVDPADNAGSMLDFVMFTEVEVGTTNTDTNVTQNINPTEFKTYLTNLDSSLSEQLKTNQVLRKRSSVIRGIIETSTENTQEIFQDHILQTQGSARKTELQTQLASLNRFQQQQQEEASNNQVKSDLGLSEQGTTDVGFSTEPTESLTDDLKFVNKTPPVKIGDLVVSKELSPAQTGIQGADSQTEYDLSLTPYSGILEIPDYGSLKAAGHHVVYGADVTVRDSVSGNRLYNVTDSAVLSQGLSSVQTSLQSLNLSTATVDYFVFENGAWQSKATSLTLGSQGVSALSTVFEALPMVLVVRQGLQAATQISIPGYQALSSPAILVRGSHNGSAGTVSSVFSQTGDVVLDVGTLNSDTFTYRIPDHFQATQVQVLGESVSLVSGGKKTVKLNIDSSDNGSTESVEDQVGLLSPVDDSTLKSTLLSGSVVLGFPGFDDFIETRSLYDAADWVSFNPSASGTAAQAASLILTHANRYLRSTAPQFEEEQSLSWVATGYEGTASYEVQLNPSETPPSITVSMTEKTTDSSVLLSWQDTFKFQTGKISRSVEKTFSSTVGIRRGSSYQLSAEYIGSSTDAFSVKFSSQRLDRQSFGEGSELNASELSSNVEGSALYTYPSSAPVVLSGRLIQNSLTYKRNQSGDEFSLIAELSGEGELRNGVLGFEGDLGSRVPRYTANNSSYMRGKLLLKNSGQYEHGDSLNGAYNVNKLRDGIFAIRGAIATNGTIDNSLQGVWQDTSVQSSGCETGRMILSVGDSSQSYVAILGDETFGAEEGGVSGNADDLFFFHEGVQWGQAGLNGNVIEGSFSHRKCSGSFSLSRQ